MEYNANKTSLDPWEFVISTPQREGRGANYGKYGI